MPYRQEPILQLLDGIYSLMIIRFLDVSERARAHRGPYVPLVTDHIKVESDLAYSYDVLVSQHGLGLSTMARATGNIEGRENERQRLVSLNWDSGNADCS